MWVLDGLDDIRSDMSVFHRIDDIATLDGPRFFRLAWRLPAYQGVMRARLLTERKEQQELPSATSGTAAPTGSKDWNPGTQATLMADPDLQGLFSFG